MCPSGSGPRFRGSGLLMDNSGADCLLQLAVLILRMPTVALTGNVPVRRASAFPRRRHQDRHGVDRRPAHPGGVVECFLGSTWHVGDGVGGQPGRPPVFAPIRQHFEGGHEYLDRPDIRVYQRDCVAKAAAPPAAAPIRRAKVLVGAALWALSLWLVLPRKHLRGRRSQRSRRRSRFALHPAGMPGTERPSDQDRK